MKRLSLVFALLAVAFWMLALVGGCARTPPPRPIEVVAKTVEVPTRVACPAPDERERLRTARPPPLRDQPMPDTATERVGKTVAQLGRYEARGGWADQVDAALDRCQQGSDPK